MGADCPVAASAEAAHGPASEGSPPSPQRHAWILRTGAPWEDQPARYGAAGTVSSRFYRWRKAGVFDRVLQRLQAQADARGELDWDLHFVDATVVRAHQYAAGARRSGAIGG